jgi:hypothetical protein
MTDLIQAERNFINRSVNTLGQLKLISISPRRDGSIVKLEGTPNGLYTYNSTSTATPNNLDVVKPDAITLPAAGRWLRSGIETSNDGTLAANSDNVLPTQKAVKTAIDNAIVEGVDEDQIYYTRSGGNDSNDGENIADGFLNYSFAFTTVAGQTPDSTNQYTVSTIDSYVYSGGFNMATLQYTNVFGPNTTVKANDASINSNCTVTLNVLQRLSGIGDVLIKTGTGKATFKVNKLINTISSGNLFIDNGILEATIDELTAPTRTDTIISANPVNPNKVLRLNTNIMRGKIFTTSISDVWKINSKFHDGDFSLNAASKLYDNVQEWTGNITAGGALAEATILVNKRNSPYSSDVFSDGDKIFIHEIAQRKYISIPLDYDTNYQTGRGKNLAVSGTSRLTFYIPDNLNNIREIWVRGNPSAGAATSGRNIDLSINAGALNEPYNQHSATDTTSTYDFTGQANELTELFDLLTLLPALSGGDNVLLQITSNVIGGTIALMDVIIKYNY